jgi:transposase InsO family protein
MQIAPVNRKFEYLVYMGLNLFPALLARGLISGVPWGRSNVAHLVKGGVNTPPAKRLYFKSLPRMPDETSRRYLFVAIDRASRWVFLHIYDNPSEESSLDFLKRLQAACPIRIRTILTDNGKEFTDRFTSRQKQPSGRHAFDHACARAQIDHRLIPPRHPQTDGVAKRIRYHNPHGGEDYEMSEMWERALRKGRVQSWQAEVQVQKLRAVDHTDRR